MYCPQLLERFIARRLLEHLGSSGVLPRLQSAYRANLCVETAVLKVLSDILLAIDNADLSSLVLLDLSSALRSITMHILLQRLELTLNRVGDVALNSYLVERKQQVRTGRLTSALDALQSTTAEC